MNHKREKRHKSIRFIAILGGFCIIFGINLFIAESGFMSYVTIAGMKLQHLLDGQKKTFADSTNMNEELVPAAEIAKGTVVIQPLQISENMLGYNTVCIAVLTGTFQRQNKGDFVIKFQQGDYVVRKIIDMSQLQDNDYVEIRLDGNELKEGNATVTCYSDGEPEKSIAVICTNQCVFYEAFYLNGIVINDKNIKMKIYEPF